MKDVSIYLRDITDSAEYYAAKPSPIYKVFIFSSLFLLLVTFLWANLFEWETVTKCKGEIVSTKEPSIIVNLIEGKVSKINVKDNDRIRKGALLYEIDTSELNSVIKDTKKTLADYNERISIMSAYINVLSSGDSLYGYNNNKYYGEYSNRLQELHTSIKLEKKSLNNADSDTKKLTESKAYLTEKTTVYNERGSYIEKTIDLKKQIKEYKNQLDKSKVCANANGIAIFKMDLKKDAFLQGGAEVIEILPDNGEYDVVAYLSSGALGDISKGDEVELEFSAFPKSDYGLVKGLIKNISSKAKVSNESTGEQYYILTIKINKDKMNKDIKLNYSNACECRIITDRTSVLNYLLNKIDLGD